MERRCSNKDWQTLDGPHACYIEGGREDMRKADGQRIMQNANRKTLLTLKVKLLY
jgi:hypothetical protein